MPNLMIRSMTDTDLQEFANQVKDALAGQLNMPALDKYYIVVGRSSTWGRFRSWVLGDKKDLEDGVRILVLQAGWENKE